MNTERIDRQIAAQRACFNSHETIPLAFRLGALRRLKDGIGALDTEIKAALYADLGKSATEAHLSEISMVLADIRYYLTHLNRLARARVVPLSPSLFPATGEVTPCPLGNVLVISPWNYPFLLALAPVVAALAAGNTALLKPSELAPETAKVLHKLFSQCLPARLCALVPGAVEETQYLLDQDFDHIFYTGNPEVGRIVMQKAAAQLTPVTLELGGKSPCIVDETANLPFAARRIVFGKFLNCGQTCVAPDYLLVHESVREELLWEMRRAIRNQYTPSPLDFPDYGRIVNTRHFDRLAALIDPEKVYCGGKTRPKTLQIEPTVLHGVTWEDAVMQAEIFGPILPVLDFSHIETAMSQIAARPHPLALYLFSENAELQRSLMQRLRFGGGCINDTVIHLCSPYLPFGGVGQSGMGAYHGKAGFDCFTHYKSILQQSTQLDLPLRYPPYTSQKSKLLERILR